MPRADNILRNIAATILKGTKYYIVKNKFFQISKEVEVIDGPWNKKEIIKRLKKLNDKEAYIVTWNGKNWTRVKE